MPDVRCFVFLLAAAATVFPSVTSAPDTCDTNGKPVVEVLVVFDDYSWQNWTTKAQISGNSMIEEVESVFFEAGKLLQDAGIELRIKDILHEPLLIIPKDKIYNKNWVDTFVAFRRFIAYMRKLYEELEKYSDVALMIAGEDLADGDSNGDGGIAKLSKACTPLQFGLIEATYDMRMSIAIAHEIAHLLSVTHDGNGNDCLTNDGYIMTARTNPTSANSYTWSQCSKDTLKEFFASDRAQCLYKTTSKPIKAKRLGQLISADETCVRANGADSFVHRFHTQVPMCLSLTCIRNVKIKLTQDTGILSWTRTMNLKYSPAGLPCGNGKSCYNGKCVADPSAPSDMNEQCLFGDAPVFRNSVWNNCYDVMTKKDGCLYKVMKLMCCDACS